MVSSEELFHQQPVREFATKKGRRAFLLFGSLAFVFGFVVIFVAALVNLTSAAPIPKLSGVGLPLAPIGILFFGYIAINVWRGFLGQQGDIGLVISPTGFTDLSQITAPQGIVAWNNVESYRYATVLGEPMIIVRLKDQKAYQKTLGSSPIKQAVFKMNSLMYGGPIHAIVLNHLEVSGQTVLESIQYMTGKPPSDPS